MTQPLFDNILQVGVVVRDVDAVVEQYRQLLGLQDWHINYVDTAAGKGRGFYTGDRPITAKAKIAWTELGNVELELIEPRDDDSVYAHFLAEKGPGLHHLMLATRDYDECTRAMDAGGVPKLGGGELQGSRFRMYDTQHRLGLIFEIAEGEALQADEPA